MSSDRRRVCSRGLHRAANYWWAATALNQLPLINITSTTAVRLLKDSKFKSQTSTEIQVSYLVSTPLTSSVLKWDATAFYFLQLLTGERQSFTLFKWPQHYDCNSAESLAIKPFNHQLLFLLKSQSFFFFQRTDSILHAHAHTQTQLHPILLFQNKAEETPSTQLLNNFKWHRLTTSFQKRRHGSFRRQDLWKVDSISMLAVYGQGFLLSAQRKSQVGFLIRRYWQAT